ncbi:conserved hypothetical protein [Hyella patelloides LEGE 07179]|uniref:Glycosyl transferase n=1 Tax=Hyella patelloides LEGE 07179 TaxID=945734 RepID=A0A563VZ43_9CYAN|nr:glycosyl transferase [Hyella patelloides]VEP16533.1 conserved hypothetical protein [Hyella patelloides LEGE 07179]
MNTPPKLYIAVTSHGFGHAVRVASVAAEIKKICLDLELVFATTAPQWLLKSYITDDFIYRPQVFDVGVIQTDSLTMDKSATLNKMAEIKAQQEAIITQEVEFIQQNNVGLILADIPPLVTEIAQKANIPCWMMSNFGWDFIYRPWGEDFAEIVAWITECYEKCDRLFRLPLNESMAAFPVVTDVGLTGGTPKYGIDELKQKFAITAPQEKTVLLTFGGLGLQAIPYQNLERFSDWQFITFDRQAPDLANLLKVGGSAYRPVDFMPLCGRVISKPGYSTFAEALRLEIPLVSLTREDFAESPVLLKGLQDYSVHQIISNQDFFESDWSFLLNDLTPPRTKITLPKDGSETIAKEVVNFLKT